MTTPASDGSSTHSDGGQKLWAGKYKTPEEMEEAIKGKDSEYTKLNNNFQEAKAQAERLSKAPDMYEVPKEAEFLGEELTQIKSRARLANMPQEQFEKLATEIANDRKAEEEKFDAKAKEVGDANMVLLNEYVKNVVPEPLRKQTLRELVNNPQARAEAFKNREKLLNNRIPGMGEDSNDNSGGKTTYDGQKECLDLARAYEKDKGNHELKKKLINTAREVGQARWPDKTRGS